MQTNLITNLKSAGLPEKAALIYASVLETGTAYPSKISEITKLNRSTVYKILDDLRIKGLVTKIEHNNKLCYQIESPSHLSTFAKKQIFAAEQRYEHAKNILPELEGLYSLLPNKPHVRFFEGLNGILEIYQEHVTAAEPYEMLSYSNVEELIKLLPKKFIDNYVKHKEKIGIKTRAIFPDTPFSQAYNKKIYSKAPKNILINSKRIKPESFLYKADITIFGKQKVSIINFHENSLIGTIIDDPTISGMMRMIFELAWKGTS